MHVVSHRRMPPRLRGGAAYTTTITTLRPAQHELQATWRGTSARGAEYLCTWHDDRRAPGAAGVVEYCTSDPQPWPVQDCISSGLYLIRTVSLGSTRAAPRRPGCPDADRRMGAVSRCTGGRGGVPTGACARYSDLTARGSLISTQEMMMMTGHAWRCEGSSVQDRLARAALHPTHTTHAMLHATHATPVHLLREGCCGGRVCLPVCLCRRTSVGMAVGMSVSIAVCARTKRQAPRPSSTGHCLCVSVPSVRGLRVFHCAKGHQSPTTALLRSRAATGPRLRTGAVRRGHYRTLAPSDTLLLARTSSSDHEM
ncbi:hypothetical protein MRB53_038051 [Persea americana]|nr:hypothetical protein MRB53_038051 [Persea americana]